MYVSFSGVRISVFRPCGAEVWLYAFSILVLYGERWVLTKHGWL